MRSTVKMPDPVREPVAAKVPEITLLFWVIKVLTTGMGEAASDFLGNVNLVLAGLVGIFGFVFALWLQFRVRRYIAVVYWFAVAMVAVFGTMAADGLHVALGIPYLATTAFYLLVVAGVFFLWHRSEGTLSIHSIVTRRRETYYWITVFATFALGTAAGDLTATSLSLGFFTSGVLFAVAITIPALAWWRFDLNPVFAFWFAYIITRPLGASFADWFGKPHSIGSGLGDGDGTVTGILTIAIVALVAYVAITRRDIQSATLGNAPLSDAASL
ncbi:MAG TPA: hypothetical protein VHX59_02775 [Mycobacteriales bacterium]|nr:hypothetical protein [Mycobacteriales bacterium]